LPEREETHLLTRGLRVAHLGERPPQDLRIERAGETAVAGDWDNRNGRDRVSPLEQGQPHGARGLRRARHQLEHPVGVGSHRLDAHLRPAEARRGDELHRSCQLARIRDGSDASL